jgi:hypothetical protein
MRRKWVHATTVILQQQIICDFGGGSAFALRTRGLQLADHNRPIRELVQQQTSHDAKAGIARTFDQALYALHVSVVATQFVGDVSCLSRALGDYMPLAKHLEQMSARGTQITASTIYRSRTIALGHMPDQEAFHGALVE